MRYALKIITFGWRYFKNYRTRFFLGILCGVLYALLNGGSVWLVRALQDRFSFTQGAPSIVTQPVGQMASPGSDVMFQVTATGPPVFFYQWLFNKTNAVGINTNFFRLANVQPSDAGSYSVIVMSPFGNRASVEADLIVTNLSSGGTIPLAKKSSEAWLPLEWVHNIKDTLKTSLGALLPQMGQAITWKHWLCLLLFLPLLAAVRGSMDYLSNYCLGWVGERAVRDLRLDVMDKLSMLSLDFFSRSTTGDLITRINTDTQNLLRSMRTALPDLIKESFSLIVVFGVLWWLDWRLMLVVVLIAPGCILPIVVLGRKARMASRAARKQGVSQTSQLVELIGGIRVIKSFSLEKEEIERFRKTSHKIVRADMKGVQAKESIGPIVEVISALGLGLLFLYILYHAGAAKNLLPFAAAFLFLFQSIKKLAGVHVLFEQTHISVDRVMDILNEKPKVVDPPAPIPFTGFKSGISLQNVNFSYRDRQVLSDVNLEIQRGFKLGVAGESGSGKTTLVNLLFRFYDPTAGAIKVDGLDLREISFLELRQQMALVSQDVVIFDQTVAENIAAGKRSATRAEVEAAAKSAFAHEFIMQLPLGYETRVGERGVTLSGGQRQRIAIARAFVRNAPILVLDEATASLDSKAEAEVQAAIDRLAEHRTVVSVAHRLSTLAAMDKIIVLSEGRIIETGSFEELLTANGVFAGMAARQGIYSAASRR